jgi:hypothetical protein
MNLGNIQLQNEQLIASSQHHHGPTGSVVNQQTINNIHFNI